MTHKQTSVLLVQGADNCSLIPCAQGWREVVAELPHYSSGGSRDNEARILLHSLHLGTVFEDPLIHVSCRVATTTMLL